LTLGTEYCRRVRRAPGTERLFNAKVFAIVQFLLSLFRYSMVSAKEGAADAVSNTSVTAAIVFM
jgi:hypothetical protein